MVDNTPRVASPYAVIASLLLAMVGCDKSATPIVAPVTAEQRVKLSPAVQHLLSDFEAGKTTGALASDYAAALEEAIQVTDEQKSTVYTILLDSRKAEHPPTLAVNVGKDDCRIKGCGIDIPTW